MALGSRLAAELYDCRVLEADVEDHPDNATRFVWLGREASPAASATKTSVVFWGGGDQSPGWLVEGLRELSDRAVNLTRIESRPRRVALGHYMFFADVEGGVADPAVASRAGGAAGAGGGTADSRLLHQRRGASRLH